MGIKERRLIGVITEENIPWHVRTFQEYCGGELSVEVDWPTIEKDHEALLNLNGYVIGQFTSALNLVGNDPAAKEGVREGLKTLKVINIDDAAQRSLAIDGTTLTITAAPVKGWDGVFSSREIADFILEKL